MAKRLARALSGWDLLLLPLALLGAGALYQAAAAARDRRSFPAQGKLVDVDGHRLHIICAGEGSPSVILDAGLAGLGADWALVQSEVARFACVCAYDRAGYGWSDPGPLPRTSERIAGELHTLLQRARVPAPYVLVGHSFGGFNIRVFVGRYPSEVAGLVLVDPAVESFASDLTPTARARLARIERAEVPALRLAALLARVGIVRLVAGGFSLGVLDLFNALPWPARAQARSQRYLPGFFETAHSELLTFAESGYQAAAAGPLGSRPVVMLTATGQGDIGQHPLPFMGIDPSFVETLLAARVRAHANIARRLSTNIHHIVTSESGHLIMLSQPERVVDAIREVVGRVRADRQLTRMPPAAAAR